MRADLHMHSTASDGTLEPSELIRLGAQRGLTHMALTDHDSVAGFEQAKKTAGAMGITLLTGVELSCGAAKEIHVLGYGFDPNDGALLSFCKERTAEREERAAMMVSRLAENGKVIALERVRALARGVMARPHVARALVEAGYATSVKDAFDRFLVPGRCGYVPKREVKVSEAVALIRQAGGLAVLAHPMELKMGEMAIEALVHEWKKQGLSGIEVYHPSAANNSLPFLRGLANRETLLVTSGSDYHGTAVRNVDLGTETLRWTSMENDVRALFAAMGKQA